MLCVSRLKGLIIDLESLTSEEYFRDFVNLVDSGRFKCIFSCTNDTKRRYQGGKADTWYFHYYDSEPIAVRISECLSRLKLNITEVAFVSSDHNNVIEAMKNACGTILICKDISEVNVGSLPDLILRSTKPLSSKLGPYHNGFYAEEAIMENTQPNDGLRKILKVYLNEDPLRPVYILGRYFKTKDYVHHFHPLSRAIVQNKSSGRTLYGKFNARFEQMYIKVIDSILKELAKESRGNADKDNGKLTSGITICSVPPHLGKEDRFRQIVSNIAEKYHFCTITDSFTCIREYESQKDKTRTERKNNVEGAFNYEGNSLHGQSVILLDDIMTSGATLDECSKILLNAGAKKIYIIVLGVTQDIYPYWEEKSNLNPVKPRIRCPNTKCNSIMELNAISKDLSFKFFCNEDNCGRVIKYNEGKNRLTAGIIRFNE